MIAKNQPGVSRFASKYQPGRSITHGMISPESKEVLRSHNREEDIFSAKVPAHQGWSVLYKI